MSDHDPDVSGLVCPLIAATDYKPDADTFDHVTSILSRSLADGKVTSNPATNGHVDSRSVGVQ